MFCHRDYLRAVFELGEQISELIVLPILGLFQVPFITIHRWNNTMKIEGCWRSMILF